MADAKSSMELCVNDIKMWMQSHFLKLNDDKTEILLFILNTDKCRLCFLLLLEMTCLLNVLKILALCLTTT